MKTLRDKVIVITGASSGIGEAMAKEYAAQGAKVVLGARSVQKLQLLAGDIRSTGGRAAYCGVDVTKPAECKELIDTAVREFGGIDVLICNAGISMRAIFDDVELDVLHKLMDVNFWVRSIAANTHCPTCRRRKARSSAFRPSPGCTDCPAARVIRLRNTP